nr:UbiX family flavin prenyltransferase [uncultured Cellulosilyticum sp.]
MKLAVGITGASGSIYAKVLVEALLEQDIVVYVVMTETAKAVFQYELDETPEEWIERLSKANENQIFLEDNNNIFAGIASGSFGIDGMIVLPCSMGTLSDIANGSAKKLLTRAADVCLKERKKLIICPRETPLSRIHLKNMLAIDEAGGIILPAMPGFYHKPQTLEEIIKFVVGKVLDVMGISHDLFEKWS